MIRDCVLTAQSEPHCIELRPSPYVYGKGPASFLDPFPSGSSLNVLEFCSGCALSPMLELP